MGVVDTRLASATLSGTGAPVYTAHRGWLDVVTDISAASTGGVLVFTARRSYASAVLGVVILSVRHTHAL